MKTLSKEDLNAVVKALPAELRTLMKECAGMTLAGGFIRSVITHEDPVDVDIFGRSKDEMRRLCERLAKSYSAIVLNTRDAFTIEMEPPVQFVHRWIASNPHALIASFDFTIAKAAIWFEGASWSSVCHERFYQDVATKRLTYARPEGADRDAGSILRVIKFVRRGYTITPDNLAGVLGRLYEGINLAEQQGREFGPFCAEQCTKLLDQSYDAPLTE